MKPVFLIFFLILSVDLFAQKNLKLNSPDQQISFSFHVTKEGPFYSISFKNKPIVNQSSVSLDLLETGEFKKNIKVGKPIFHDSTEDYELIVGKTKRVH